MLVCVFLTLHRPFISFAAFRDGSTRLKSWTIVARLPVIVHRVTARIFLFGAVTFAELLLHKEGMPALVTAVVIIIVLHGSPVRVLRLLPLLRLLLDHLPISTPAFLSLLLLRLLLVPAFFHIW